MSLLVILFEIFHLSQANIRKLKDFFLSLLFSWAIWKERNRVVFDDEVFSKSRLKSCFLFSFSSWAGLLFDVEHPFARDIFNIP